MQSRSKRSVIFIFKIQLKWQRVNLVTSAGMNAVKTCGVEQNCLYIRDQLKKKIMYIKE